LSPTEVDDEIADLLKQVGPTLFSKPHYIVGPVLADFTAYWLSGFNSEERQQILKDFVNWVFRLHLVYVDKKKPPLN